MRIVVHEGAVERKKDKPLKVNWLPDVDEEHYQAARNYLGLIMPDEYADKAVAILRRSPISQGMARDVVRGSRLGVIPEKIPGVKREMEQMEAGEPHVPLLLVQGSPDPESNMCIADGFHRAHAAYYLDPEMVVPFKIAKGVFDD